MAREVLTIAGTVVGAYFGVPQLGFMIGSAVGNAVDPVQIKGPSIGDVKVQTTQEGSPIAWVFGRAAVAGTIIDRGEPKIVKRETQQGKGGGPETVEERLLLTFAILISEPISQITRIWENDKLVYDITEGSQIFVDSIKFAENFVVYLGSETQTPDPTLEAIHGVGNTPYHRGTAYIVFDNYDVTEKGQAVPRFLLEVTQNAGEQQLLFSNGGTDATSAMTPFQVSSTPYGGFTGTASEHWHASEGSPAPGLMGNGYFRGNVAGQGIIRFDFKRGPGSFGFDGWGHTVSFLCGDGIGGPTGGGPSLRLTPHNANGDPKQPSQYGYRTTDHTLPDTFVQLGTFPSYNDDNWHHCDIYIGAGNVVNIYIDDVLVISNWSVGAYVGGSWIYWSRELNYNPNSFLDNVAVYAPSGYGDSPTLASVLTQIHSRVGYAPTDIDVSDHTATLVRGFAYGGMYPAAQAIRELGRAYLYGAFAADLKLRYPALGQANSFAIVEDDLLEDPDILERKQEIELPRKYHLGYQNSDLNYATVKATSLRASPDIRVTGEAGAQLAVIMTETEAAQLADKHHKIMWNDLEGEFTLKVADRLWASLTPTDCGTVTFRGITKRVRIQKIEAADGILTLTVNHDRQSSYTSNVAPVIVRDPLTPPSTYVGDTVFVYANMPVFNDADDALGYYVGGASEWDGWRGWQLDRSVDAGVTYSYVATLSEGAVIGELLATLETASPYTTDTQNELRLSLVGPADYLEDASRSQVLRSANAMAIINADGTVEVVQFQDVTEESDNVWVCTTLLRGRKNTTASSHATGSLCVLLSTLSFVPTPASLISDDLYHRPTSIGNVTSLSTQYDNDFDPALSQREWAPCYLRTSRSGDNLTATWSPRPRLGDSRYPFESTNFDGYRVTLTKGANTSTFDQTASTFTVDTSALGAAPVDISIRGINRITGVGDELTGSA